MQPTWRTSLTLSGSIIRRGFTHAFLKLEIIRPWPPTGHGCKLYDWCCLGRCFQWEALIAIGFAFWWMVYDVMVHVKYLE